MTCNEVLARLKSLGDEKTRAMYLKQGADENCFGVKMGDLRAVAKELKSNHELGLELWASRQHEAMMLACQVMSVKKLTNDEIERMIREIPVSSKVINELAPAPIADWFLTNIVKVHPEKESFRVRWMTDSHPVAARGGWSLTTERVNKNPDGLDLPALLDRIEKEMPTAPEVVQWMMNYCLASIGIEFAEHRARALAIGEKLGLYKNYPVSKGCTSPFAPIWITAMVDRQKN